tara:strand:+ start:1148 stop:1405 length:258 start_codon:yes stop_codon:yes gene_type:complete
MITLKKDCENGAKYFHFEEGKFLIRIYVRQGQGDYSYCSVTTNKQRNRMSLPKVWHGEDCLHDALNSYKNASYKKAFRSVLCELA